MSRIGKLPIQIGEKVKVEIVKSTVKVAGPKGNLEYNFPEEVEVKLDGATITVQPKAESDRARAMWGLARNLIANMVIGVSEGYKKVLEINGVGYRAAADKEFLTVYIGYSHEIKYVIPQDRGIEIVCPKPTSIEISGSEKQLVGQIAAEIKSLRRYDPYKGKGIKLEGEVKRRKEGKKK